MENYSFKGAKSERDTSQKSHLKKNIAKSSCQSKLLEAPKIEFCTLSPEIDISEIKKFRQLDLERKDPSFDLEDSRILNYSHPNQIFGARMDAKLVALCVVGSFSSPTFFRETLIDLGLLRDIDCCSSAEIGALIVDDSLRNTTILKFLLLNVCYWAQYHTPIRTWYARTEAVYAPIYQRMGGKILKAKKQIYSDKRERYILRGDVSKSSKILDSKNPKGLTNHAEKKIIIEGPTC